MYGWSARPHSLVHPPTPYVGLRILHDLDEFVNEGSTLPRRIAKLKASAVRRVESRNVLRKRMNVLIAETDALWAKLNDAHVFGHRRHPAVAKGEALEVLLAECRELVEAVPELPTSAKLANSCWLVRACRPSDAKKKQRKERKERKEQDKEMLATAIEVKKGNGGKGTGKAKGKGKGKGKVSPAPDEGDSEAKEDETGGSSER